MFPIKNQRGSVAVLMSTYNGERYVREQVNSILKQLSVGDQLLIRDDGSMDGTVDFINKLCDPRISIVSGENVGFFRSFLWLLYHVDRRHSIYMLADQDDVWLPGKIDRARESLESRADPCLYCTRLQIVDESLNKIGISPFINKPPSFQNAICENIATGCTIALNRLAMDIIRKPSFESINSCEIYYHDWWLYLNLAYFGCVIWDPEPSIMYRQHANNIVGMGSGITRYWRIWTSVKRKSWVRILVAQLRSFLYLYEECLPEHDRKWLISLCEGQLFKIAWSLMTDRRLQRQQPMDQMLFRCLVLFDFFRGKLK